MSTNKEVQHDPPNNGEDRHDLHTHQRLLQFINQARVPADLMVLPHDVQVVDEIAAHQGDIPHHVEVKRTLEPEVAKDLFLARNRQNIIGGFTRFADLRRVLGRDLIDRILALLGPYNYGRWDYLYPMELDGMELSIEHAALLHTGDVLFIESGTETILWDPADETTADFTVIDGATTGLTANLFCSGHVFLSNGELLVVGGGGGGPGTPSSIQGWRYDPVTQKWQQTGDMTTKRWYPTAVMLGDELGPTGYSGRVLVAGGLGGSGGMEIYSEATNSFAPVTVTGPIVKHFSQTYPGLHLLPGGEVFYAPTGFDNCDTADVGGYSDGPSAYFTFNAPQGSNSGHWTEVSSPEIDRAKGMSALILQPSYPFVRVIAVGGGPAGTNKTAQTINLSTLSPSWGPTTTIPDGRSRVNVSTVLLPNSTVLVCGGLESSPYPTWIYNPNTPINAWRLMDENHRPRHYHSCALLLPSGKVMMAGGAAPGGCSLSVENSIEVFSPPYLFNPDGTLADRPDIDSVDGTAPTPGSMIQVHHGDTFTVETPDAADIAKVVFIRPMAVTHQTDSEQRIIHMSFYANSGSQLTVTAPDGGGPHAMAPRGYYMLFLLNGAGVPSEGIFVHLH